MINSELNHILREIKLIPKSSFIGKVSAIKGSLLEIIGLEGNVFLGNFCIIHARNNKEIIAEVVALSDKKTLAIPFYGVREVSIGSTVTILNDAHFIWPSVHWLGRVINAFGEPIDGKGVLYKGDKAYNLHNKNSKGALGSRTGEKIDMGIRSINSFLTCCRGQRMGVFAGSGIGKSTMLSMIAKFADSDVKVIGLVGERAREVQEFIEDCLGPEGLAKSVVVVATSDESALIRRQAAYLTMSLCEYFSELSMEVLCIMDNVTRFAMAQREIGLALGEPVTTKGYVPSVFSELPRLLERAGPRNGDAGAITALFSVLVEADDHNEPIADAVRGILDGHIVLNREIANRGIYPAVDILKSISRTMPKCNSAAENLLIGKARKLVARYRDNEDLIRIGAYKMGSDTEIDLAIKYHERLEEFMRQAPEEMERIQPSYAKLAELLDEDWPVLC